MGLFRRREPPLDPFERAARRSDPELATLEPVGHLPMPGLSGKNLLLYFAVGVVVVALVRDGIGSGAPELTKSCTKAAYALSGDSVRPQGVLKWSATGPSDASVLFAIDVTSAPDAGSDDLLAGPIALTGCERHGQFGVAAPSGEHVVSVFLVRADGSSTTVGTSKLTVDDR